ncbi:hypothetical protein M0802_006440 [Mischocyttarus mexicanus]|nr:hypothetical protein M0802_006440 [Mischocyttarus mexicanus]
MDEKRDDYAKSEWRQDSSRPFSSLSKNQDERDRDRHMKDVSKDPEVDSSQDYRLLLGYENKTHTVLRFSRRYDTCDSRDLKITLLYTAFHLIRNYTRSWALNPCVGLRLIPCWKPNAEDLKKVRIS